MSDCPSGESKELVLTLLRRFRYFELAEAQSAFSTLVLTAQKSWGLQPDSTFFSCISDARSASSGQVVLVWAKHALPALRQRGVQHPSAS